MSKQLWCRVIKVLRWVVPCALVITWSLIVFDTNNVLLTVNLIAYGATCWLMFMIARSSNWEDSPVGRSTMAIKGGILFLSFGGLMRRMSERIGDLTPHHDDSHLITLVDVIADHAVAVGWYTLAMALVYRIVVFTKIAHKRPVIKVEGASEQDD
jgi:hypothetical protein